MRLLLEYKDIPPDLHGGVIVLGNFDGVHRGHQSVIGRGQEIADGLGVPLVVVTFEPHPRSHFRPHDPPFRLTPLANKARQIEALGVDALVVLTFDDALSRIEAVDFVRDVLVAGLAARHVVVGMDFRFGRQRGGDAALLEAEGAANRFAVTTIAAVASADAEIYSSSHIRENIMAGKPAQAAAMLGRPFEIEGVVEHGEKRGRELGFPTANIDIGGYVHPALGVYAVRASIGGAPEWLDGVAYFGDRPTVDGKGLLLEVNLFDFDGDLYGQTMRVALIEYLRGDHKFDSLEALKAQIAEDDVTARRILRVRAAGAP
ncbi:MAG: Riboflavin biosynthesis protein RibF [Alphaproteobacteria bacterium MarineAlpha10_Bin3]|jgi:riboflavin kinase/FMN adenylyltransferase|nr:MAG: Riboflavin biosynthesis protein RibF [Alphaproteobacteria bacterium MarineAlpha10_Bin3]PPR68338.1 MAG: Riboflavin biosynthesis protein RibF [Alphaproteobacteria bacterium MarineAlpha4_Bin1]